MYVCMYNTMGWSQKGNGLYSPKVSNGTRGNFAKIPLLKPPWIIFYKNCICQKKKKKRQKLRKLQICIPALTGEKEIISIFFCF